MVLIVMGVAGAGKTTVGQKLAARLGWRFADADDYHPPENRARMAQGVPLDAAARAPWLAALARAIDGWLQAGESVVLACSALKRAYRQTLGRAPEAVSFVYLRADAALLATRLGARSGHFAGPSLLASQLATLEEPTPEEHALILDAAATPDELVSRIAAALGR